MYCTTGDVARALDVNPSTVKRWANSHVLPCVILPGGHRRFEIDSVCRFAVERGYEPDALQRIGAEQ